MEKQVYDGILRKKAIWAGPCPICGKPIDTGEMIRQPYSNANGGKNRFSNHWVCFSCARKLHCRSEAPKSSRIDTFSHSLH